MSADIIPFVPRARGHRLCETPLRFRAPARADDLAMDHADTAPCEYVPWHDAQQIDNEPA